MSTTNLHREHWEAKAMTLVRDCKRAAKVFVDYVKLQDSLGEDDYDGYVGAGRNLYRAAATLTLFIGGGKPFLPDPKIADRHGGTVQIEIMDDALGHLILDEDERHRVTLLVAIGICGDMNSALEEYAGWHGLEYNPLRLIMPDAE